MDISLMSGTDSIVLLMRRLLKLMITTLIG